MLEKFYPFLLKHLRRVATNDPDSKNMPSYLGSQIQNEVLTLLVSNIQNNIINL